MRHLFSCLLRVGVIKFNKAVFAKDGAKTQKLIEEFRSIVGRLEKITKDDETGVFHDIMKMMQSVMRHFLRKEPELKERMGDVMGGKVLPLPSDELREQRALGVQEGISQGKRNIVFNMLKRNMSIEDICAMTECDEAFVEQVRAKL